MYLYYSFYYAGTADLVMQDGYSGYVCPLPPPPPLLHIRPDCLLADKDEEHEDPAEQVEDVNGEEEVAQEGVFKVRSFSDQNRMDSFKAP